MTERAIACRGCNTPLFWIDGPVCDPCMEEAAERLAAAERIRLERQRAVEAALAIERELLRQKAEAERGTLLCTKCNQRFKSTYCGKNDPVCPRCLYGKPARVDHHYEEEEEDWTEFAPKHATRKGNKRHGKRRQY